MKQLRIVKLMRWKTKNIKFHKGEPALFSRMLFDRDAMLCGIALNEDTHRWGLRKEWAVRRSCCSECIPLWRNLCGEFLWKRRTQSGSECLLRRKTPFPRHLQSVWQYSPRHPSDLGNFKRHLLSYHSSVCALSFFLTNSPFSYFCFVDLQTLISPLTMIIFIPSPFHFSSWGCITLTMFRLSALRAFGLFNDINPMEFLASIMTSGSELVDMVLPSGNVRGFNLAARNLFWGDWFQVLRPDNRPNRFAAEAMLGKRMNERMIERNERWSYG